MGIFGKIFGHEELKSGLEGQGSKQQSAGVPSRQTWGQGENVFLVHDVYQIKGIGIVPVGIVEKGTIRPGQTTILNGKRAEIKSMEAKHQKIESAIKGQSIGINLKGAEKGDLQCGMRLSFS